ncbi:MAG: DUF5658 family protein [Dehalococcoidia bacterium]
MLPGLVGATATFKRDTVQKLSFIFLMCLDAVLTLWAMSLGLYELNPYFQGLLENPPLLFFTKVIFPCFIAWLVPGKLLLPATIFMLFVIGWNTRELIGLFTQ